MISLPVQNVFLISTWINGVMNWFDRDVLWVKLSMSRNV